VIARIEQRVESRLGFPDEKVHSGAAVLLLMRIMLAHGKALTLLEVGPLATTGDVHLRAMFEAWIDLWAVLDSKDPEDQARRMIVFGLVEFRDHNPTTAGLSTEDRAHLEEALRPYKENFAALVQDIELQRTNKDPRNRFYWSGLSRTEQIRRMQARGVSDTLLDIYKLLSWDAHHVLAVALRTTIRKDEAGELQVMFHPQLLPEDSAHLNGTLAIKMLVKAWLPITKHLQLDPG
jgi:hypothetical protein